MKKTTMTLNKFQLDIKSKKDKLLERRIIY